MSHPSPLATVQHRALALRDAGEHAAARRLLTDAVESARPPYGPDHPDTLSTAHLLARLHREADEPSAARRVLEEAFAAGERRWPHADPLMLALAFELAAVADELGNRHEARRNFTRVVTAGPAVLGEDHPAVRTARRYLGLPDPSPAAAPTPPGPGGVAAPPPQGHPAAPIQAGPAAAAPPAGDQSFAQPHAVAGHAGAAGGPAGSPGTDALTGPTVSLAVLTTAWRPHDGETATAHLPRIPTEGPPPPDRGDRRATGPGPGMPPGNRSGHPHGTSSAPTLRAEPAPGLPAPPVPPAPRVAEHDNAPPLRPVQPAGPTAPLDVPTSTPPAWTPPQPPAHGSPWAPAPPAPPTYAPGATAPPATPAVPPAPPAPIHGAPTPPRQRTGHPESAPVRPVAAGSPVQESGGDRSEPAPPRQPAPSWAEPTVQVRQLEPLLAEERARRAAGPTEGRPAPPSPGRPTEDLAGPGRDSSPERFPPSVMDLASPVSAPPGPSHPTSAPPHQVSGPPWASHPTSAPPHQVSGPPAEPRAAARTFAGGPSAHGRATSARHGTSTPGEDGTGRPPETHPAYGHGAPPDGGAPYGQTGATGIPSEAESWFGTPLRPAYLPPEEDGGRRRAGIVLAAVVGLAATAATGVGVGALVVDGDPAPTAAPVATAAAGVTPGPGPGGLALRDDAATVTLTWDDPSGGAVPFMVAGGRAGQALGVLATVDPGRTSWTVNGLNSRVDYCFTVVAVYSTDVVATSAQVCTEREGTAAPG